MSQAVIATIKWPDGRTKKQNVVVAAGRMDEAQLREHMLTLLHPGASDVTFEQAFAAPETAGEILDAVKRKARLVPAGPALDEAAAGRSTVPSTRLPLGHPLPEPVTTDAPEPPAHE